eukprot:TRINITY_DN112554_c0_g1_i1.p1 TRINITY_DN112554_c0_g1~~TRINITY_DN112554_c0_g1_i1.p1  ORF type:complete len:259 (+),score=33.58 TRINITY_DN112554_c0_g1_i1:78-779(+)
MGVTDIVLSLVTHVEALGPTGGPAAFVAVLTVWVILGLPCTLLNMVPGFLFGFKLGVACNMVGKVLGSMISFFLARLFSDRVKAWGSKYKAYRIIAKAVDKGGFVSICLVRLVYMPMSLKNYGLGALGAPPFQTFLASIVCALPFAIMWTWAGAQCKDVAEMLSKTDKKRPPIKPEYIAGAVVVLIAVYFCRKAAYQYLPEWIKEELERQSDNGDGESKEKGSETEADAKKSK